MDTKQKFDTGQVVYLMSDKSAMIKAAKVIEEIYRKTLTEEKRDYKLITTDDQEILVSSLNEVHIFNSLDEIEKKMIENATTSIKGLLNGVKKEGEKFEDKKTKSVRTKKTTSTKE